MINQGIQIIRKRGGKKQTPGNLRTSNEGYPNFECKTLELPYKDNMPNVSCVIVGNYPCRKLKESTSFKYPHIHILGVPGRTVIKIHILNYSRNLLGCVGIGEKFIDIDNDGLKDITNSKETLEKLMKSLPETFNIEIRYESRLIYFRRRIKKWRSKWLGIF